MHSKARLKKLRMMRCQRTDVEFYKNFYAKLGVQIWTTLVSVQYVTTTSQFTLSERNGLVYKPHPHPKLKQKDAAYTRVFTVSKKD